MLEELLKQSLETNPAHPIIESNGRYWSAQEVETLSLKLADGLSRLGLETMDRVAIWLPNQLETVVSYLACFKAGFVVVPLDGRHHPVQVNYSLNHSAARILIVHSDRMKDLETEGLPSGVEYVITVDDASAANPSYLHFDSIIQKSTTSFSAEKLSPDDLCMMIYTSGTTARPKGVTYTRLAMEEGIRKYLARVPISASDVGLIAAPITRPMALRSQLLPILKSGGCVSLLESFHPDTYVEALKREPAKTILALLPAALAKVLNHPQVSECNFSRLRLCIVGGDRSPQGLHEKFESITGIQLTEQYGSSESGPIAMNPPFGNKKVGSVGLPMYGSSICIVNDQGADVEFGEIGNIVVQSSYAMIGYWNDTALTRKTLHQGVIQTGDLGNFDQDGFLWFAGRKKDVIIRGGSNVSPLEVESALRCHPGVLEACVLGIDHPELGQEVHAFVTMNAKESEESMIRFASTRLADYMIPARIYVVDTLPLKGGGKVDRDRLKLRASTGDLEL